MEQHQRLSVHDIDPEAYRAVLGMERYVRNSGLPKPLYELIKIRASQLNGCAYCLDMHNRDARAGGEDQRRLDILSAWREAPRLFSEQEQTALALTEAVTLVSAAGVPDEVLAAGVQSVRRSRHGPPSDGDRHHQRMEPPGREHPSGPARLKRVRGGVT